MKALQEALERAAGVPVELSMPLQSWRGDYSCNVALQHAARRGEAPLAFAERIVAAVGAVPGIADLRAVPPGFINATLSQAGLEQLLRDAPDLPPPMPGFEVLLYSPDDRSRLVGRALARMAGGVCHELVGDPRVELGPPPRVLRTGRVLGDFVPMAVLLEAPGQDVVVHRGRPGPHNPVYSIAHARQRLEAIQTAGGRRGLPAPDISRLTLPVEHDLMRRIGELPIVIGESVRRADPSWLARYLVRLARGFHAWYDRSPVLAPEAELAAARLALAAGVGRTLTAGETLLLEGFASLPSK